MALKCVGGRLSVGAGRVRVAPKMTDNFYRSPQWVGLVRDVKAMRGRWCEKCGSGKRIIADHIIERKDGGADLDHANIMLLCHSCHQAKTARSRAARALA